MSKFKVGDKVNVLVGHENNGEPTVITRIDGNRIYFKVAESIKVAFGSEDWYAHTDGSPAFELLPREIRDVRAGDVIEGGSYGPYTVHGLVGEIVFFTDKDEASYHFSINRLESDGWTIKGPEPEEPEVKVVTMDEVAKLVGVPVNQLQIKKED